MTCPPRSAIIFAMKVAIVLNCGKQIERKISADKIICCDGGYLCCPVAPDVILGDFDSMPKPNDFEGEIVEHDSHKNAGDGELAVYYAKEALGADEIVFYGVLGGRYDHTLCNFAIMRLATDLGMSARAEEDGVNLYLARGELSLPTQKGDVISILPIGGNAIVSCSHNLEYPLDNLLLTASDSRGLSNVSKGGKVQISVKAGSVLVFRYLQQPK